MTYYLKHRSVWSILGFRGLIENSRVPTKNWNKLLLYIVEALLELLKKSKAPWKEGSGSVWWWIKPERTGIFLGWETPYCFVYLRFFGLYFRGFDPHKFFFCFLIVFDSSDYSCFYSSDSCRGQLQPCCLVGPGCSWGVYLSNSCPTSDLLDWTHWFLTRDLITMDLQVVLQVNSTPLQ